MDATSILATLELRDWLLGEMAAGTSYELAPGRGFRESAASRATTAGGLGDSGHPERGAGALGRHPDGGRGVQGSSRRRVGRWRRKATTMCGFNAPRAGGTSDGPRFRADP